MKKEGEVQEVEVKGERVEGRREGAGTGGWYQLAQGARDLKQVAELSRVAPHQVQLETKVFILIDCPSAGRVKGLDANST